jgi:hypothetical protein
VGARAGGARGPELAGGTGGGRAGAPLRLGAVPGPGGLGDWGVRGGGGGAGAGSAGAPASSPHAAPRAAQPPSPRPAPQDARGDLLPCRALRDKFKAERRDVYAPGQDGSEGEGEGEGEEGGDGGDEGGGEGGQGGKGDGV